MRNWRYWLFWPIAGVFHLYWLAFVPKDRHRSWSDQTFSGSVLIWHDNLWRHK